MNLNKFLSKRISFVKFDKLEKSWVLQCMTFLNTVLIEHCINFLNTKVMFLGTQYLLSEPEKMCSSKGREEKPGDMLPWGNMVFLTCSSEPHSFLTGSAFAL